MQGWRFLHSIRLKNLLSFGSEGVALDLEPLNVLIGPNASGKSNLIEAVSILAAAPKSLARRFRQGGGTGEWLWKGRGEDELAQIEVSLDDLSHSGESLLLTYRLSFTESNYRLRVVEEELVEAGNSEVILERSGSRFHLKPRPVGVAGQMATLALPQPRWSDLNQEESVLSYIKEPYVYPQLAFLSSSFDGMCFFRDWNFGRKSLARLPQKVDLPDGFLAEDGSNLALVLDKLRNHPPTKRLVLEKLQQFYDGIEDFVTSVQGGTIQVFLHEGDWTISPARLSDGTLHYLCLLAILCHPEPPPLVCIEEPELGLHPDIIPKVAELLVDAAQRTQLIVTTHSDALVSALSDIPEAVVVCERGEEGTRLRRLDRDKLQEWLKDYQLGELWSMGEIGGNRW